MGLVASLRRFLPNVVLLMCAAGARAGLRVSTQDDALHVRQGEEAEGAARQPRSHFHGSRTGGTDSPHKLRLLVASLQHTFAVASLHTVAVQAEVVP